MARIERRPELPLEFAPLHTPPAAACLALTFRTATTLTARVTLQLFECGLHLHGIAVTLRRIDLNGFLQHLDEFGSNPCGQAVVTGQRPDKRPFRQLSGKQPVQHEAQGEYVGVPEPDAFNVRRLILANPKSQSFRRLPGNRMKFSGLMSQ
jgi:hypothetical protein